MKSLFLPAKSLATSINQIHPVTLRGKDAKVLKSGDGFTYMCNRNNCILVLKKSGQISHSSTILSILFHASVNQTFASL